MAEPKTDAARPVPKLRWYQYSLSSLLWITIGIALLMTAIVQTTRLQILDQERRLAQRQVEELSKVLPKEIKPGWLTQVNAGPGYLFRGFLPQGDWRLAVYFWQGASPRILWEMAPPPGLAPLVAKRIPNPQDVEIRMSEASLPPGVTYTGKPVNIAFNIEIKDTRPGHRDGAFFPLSPLVLLNASGTSVAVGNAPTVSKREHILIYKGDFDGIGNHYLVLIEHAGPGSPKPQIGTDAISDFP